MKQILLLFFVAVSYCSYAQITVNITSPDTSRIYNDANSLRISGTVTSTYSVSSFEVKIDGTIIDVILNDDGSFLKFIPITTLITFREDTLKLTAVAKDAFGNEGSDSVNFIYNNPPKVTILEPKTNFAATPYVHVNLRNIDIDSCKLKILTGQYPNYLILLETTIKDSFEADIAIPVLSDLDYTSGITISVSDNLGQSSGGFIYTPLILSENNPYLKLVYKSHKTVMDFKDSLVFVTTNNGVYGNNPSIINIHTLEEKIIPGTFEQPSDFGYITSQGAAFGYENVQDTYIHEKDQILYEWNNDTLFTLYKNAYQSYFKLNVKTTGNYLCWQDRVLGSLIYKNLLTKDTLLFKTQDFDIAYNGLLCYQSVNRLYAYENGITSAFGTPYNNKYGNAYPVTDGRSTAFTKIAAFPNLPDSIFLFDGSKYTFLAEYKKPGIDPLQSYYDLNNGYTAFLKQDAASIPQVYLRHPTGITRQLTYGGIPGLRNYIKIVSPDGDVAISYRDSLFLNQADDTLRFLFKDYGKVYFTNNKKYFVIGNAIFEIDYDIVLPLTLTNFSAKRTGKTNLLQWGTTQELNTERFEIQRSNNSRDFINIGTVRAFNNGKSQNDYTYTDQLPLKATNYYRLKMVDKDGKFTYSAIRNVNNTSSLNISIYPNPVNDVLTLNFNTEKITDVQIDITDINGKKLQSKKVQLPYGASIQTLNVAALSKGTYFVQCTTKDGNIGIKFVKQ